MFHVEQIFKRLNIMVISKPEKQITVNGVTVVKFDHLYPYIMG